MMVSNFAHSNVNKQHQGNTRQIKRKCRFQILIYLIFSFHVLVDYPGVQRITFLPFKPAKREQIAETVVTDLLTIFAQVKSEGSRRLMYMYVCMPV